jgi:CRISPR system Cascade subunit CasA
MSAQGLYHSLLDEQLFGVALHSEGGGLQRVKMSLPEVLAALDAGRPQLASFEALQAHQQQAWFCFLVQLGALARIHAGIEAHADRTAWREALLKLTRGDEGAWCLVQEALNKPAFMQPPVPEGTLKEAGFDANEVYTPDVLDILILSKNHHVKNSRIQNSSLEIWIYSIINLQTMEGYSGPKNYGIVKMNSGSGSRPLIGLAPSLDWSARWNRDVAIAFICYEKIAIDFGFNESGHMLLWMVPWDGTNRTSVEIDSCTPLFIEVCRRIRFVIKEGLLRCFRVPTEAERVAHGKKLKGITGDLWMPQQIEKDGAKGLTITGRGFSYDVLRKILFKDGFNPSISQGFGESDKTAMLFWASGLARGQGTTEGLHLRLLLIPNKIEGRLRSNDSMILLANRARMQANITGLIQIKALRAALKTLYAGGIIGKSKVEISEHWMERYEQEADAQFFEHLFEHIEADDDIESHKLWFEKMRCFAHGLLMEATHAAPLPSARRWRAVAAAEQVFESSFYRNSEFDPYRRANPDEREVNHADE